MAGALRFSVHETQKENYLAKLNWIPRIKKFKYNFIKHSFDEMGFLF